MKIYICLVILFFILYLSIFKKDYLYSKFLGIRFKIQEKSYDQINKKTQYAKYLKSKKTVDFYVKHKLISQNKIDQISSQLKVIGENDPISYISNFIVESRYLILIGIVTFLMSFYFKFMTVNGLANFGMLTVLCKWFGLIITISGVFAIYLLPAEIAAKKQKIFSEIERDYPKLLNHVYYYYCVSNTHLLLPEVLRKFSGNVSKGTTTLIENAIEDSKYSEIYALENIKEKYSDIIKIVNLADKVKRCIEGFTLGPEYLKGLHDQMIAEEDFAREQKEQKKSELYLGLMVVSISAVLIFQVIGIGIEILS